MNLSKLLLSLFTAVFVLMFGSVAMGPAIATAQSKAGDTGFDQLQKERTSVLKRIERLSASGPLSARDQRKMERLEGSLAKLEKQLALMSLRNEAIETAARVATQVDISNQRLCEYDEKYNDLADRLYSSGYRDYRIIRQRANLLANELLDLLVAKGIRMSETSEPVGALEGWYKKFWKMNEDPYFARTFSDIYNFDTDPVAGEEPLYNKRSVNKDQWDNFHRAVESAHRWKKAEDEAVQREAQRAQRMLRLSVQLDKEPVFPIRSR